MKYIRQTSRFIRTDYKTNAEISKELNTIPVVDKTQAYRNFFAVYIYKQNAS